MVRIAERRRQRPRNAIIGQHLQAVVRILRRRAAVVVAALGLEPSTSWGGRSQRKSNIAVDVVAVTAWRVRARASAWAASASLFI